MGKLQGLGDLMVFGVKLQFYFLYRVLLGGIIFGLFPGFLFVYRVVNSCFEEKMITHLDLKSELNRLTKTEVMKVNLCGYLLLFFLWILGINLQVISIFIGSPALRFLTFGLLILTLNTGLYLLPILAKYELPIKQYFLQSFLLGVISIIDTIAILLGASLAFAISLIPPIGFFVGIPFIFIPYVWFSRASIRRLEAVLYQGQDYIGETSSKKEDQ
ncbi:MAG: hypothetical protein FWG67_07585 [Defluviitaleaceae bacterium]|nr:hypothetical protein [Defluviitaleaceae bacterium]